MSGLISRAFLAGSHDPSRYYKKYPQSTWIQKGGYEIQTTPDELAAVISHTRAYLKGNRMLCLGAETLGAERFLAENLGILEIDVCILSSGNELAALNRNVASMTGIKVNLGANPPKGRYDIVTVFGGATLENVLDHVKIGSFIVFLGTTEKENSRLRMLWMQTRKAHMAQLQSGGLPYETGVGVAKVLFVNPDKEVKSDDNNRDEARGAQAEEPSEKGDSGEPAEAKEEVRAGHGEHHGESDSGRVPGTAPVKRKPGRPPRVVGA